MVIRRDVLLVMVVLIGGWGAAAEGQSNSLYQRGNIEAMQRTTRSGAMGEVSGPQLDVPYRRAEVQKSTGRSVLHSSWFTVEEPSPKDFRVHDLVTIVVHEVSKHSSRGDTQAERSYEIDAQLEDWFRLTQGRVERAAKNHGEPALKLTFDREFEGEGDTEREDTVTARIQAEVIDVLPNGNLILEARHKVVTDEEKTEITLTGLCRSKDVGVDNTLLSSQIARLELHKRHEGIVRDATKRGLISGLFDWLGVL